MTSRNPISLKRSWKDMALNPCEVRSLMDKGTLRTGLISIAQRRSPKPKAACRVRKVPLWQLRAQERQWSKCRFTASQFEMNMFLAVALSIRR